jgi:hypothetical protein
MVGRVVLSDGRLMNNETRQPLDTSSPTLLLVSLAGVLAAVAGVIALGQTSATAVLFAAIVVLLAGTAIVTMTIGRQLDDADGRAPRDAAPSDGNHHPS